MLQSLFGKIYNVHFYTIKYDLIKISEEIEKLLGKMMKSDKEKKNSLKTFLRKKRI